jgi:5-methylcytosine-specific restriction endonuclease McrA
MHYRRVLKGNDVGAPGPRIQVRGDCSVEDCTRKADSKGMCEVHYQRVRRTGLTKLPERPIRCCEADNCDRQAKCHGLCNKHYQRLRTTGTTADRVRVERTCTVEGCDRPYLAQGLCKRHYSSAAYQRDIEKGRAEQRARRAANPERSRQRGRDYRKRNNEKIVAQEKALRQANPQRYREKARLYRQRHPEKVAEMKRRWADETAEARAAYFAEYQRQNRMKRRASNAMRKAWLKSTQVEPVSYEQVVAIHGMTCHLCGEQIASEGDLHVDHVIPRERGGTHTYGNLRPAHALCNLRKGTKLMSELTWVIRAS